jgi:hypothetical protein
MRLFSFCSPDRYKYDMPYIHKLVADGRECKLTIKQKRFKETGFASTGNAQGTSIVQHFQILPRVKDTAFASANC